MNCLGRKTLYFKHWVWEVTLLCVFSLLKKDATHFHYISLTSTFLKSLFHATGLEFISIKIRANNLKSKLSVFFTSSVSSSKRSVFYVCRSFTSDTTNMSTIIHFLELVAIYMCSVLLKYGLAVSLPLIQITAICFP